MNQKLELWQFIADRLTENQPVVLLTVAESSGSSPGHAGYKMAVSSGGELCGSIGGGLMEVTLVEKSREILSAFTEAVDGFPAFLIPQIHQRNAENASGMICSGRQTVISSLLTSHNSAAVAEILNCLKTGDRAHLFIAHNSFELRTEARSGVCPSAHFESHSETEFSYSETLGYGNRLFIIGGGHCALSLSELMSKMNFHISIFDDRPHLNTIEKNRFAHKIAVIDSYEEVGDLIDASQDSYVVVMTLGYASDEMVIRSLIHKDFKYFGVLGSKAKMAALLKSLKSDGLKAEHLARIRTPIGLPINSHTPDEIAVSIAAEIISVKNAKRP